jgi:predicted O-methyltransferase YrrM
MEEYWRIDLDYPVRPKARWGYGKPPLQPLYELLDRDRARYTETLARCLRYREQFAAIGREYVSEDQPYWQCGWLPPLDLVLLYTFIAEERPRRYIEVGSGCSTTFVRRAITDFGLDTRIISIDPEPRALVDAICDEVIRQPLEDVDLGLFDGLTSGDVVFIDGSHRSFANSDATVAVLEVLPRLGEDVVVAFDDICLPHDYPPHWADRFYSEQYLLAAWLLGGGGGLDVIAPIDFVSHDEELGGILAPLWSEGPLAGLIGYGNSFWMRVRA